jgi:cytochrome oxidase Cu insertion factor (SCO1/SenC/PrrC family)
MFTKPRSRVRRRRGSFSLVVVSLAGLAGVLLIPAAGSATSPRRTTTTTTTTPYQGASKIGVATSGPSLASSAVDAVPFTFPTSCGPVSDATPLCSYGGKKNKVATLNYPSLAGQTQNFNFNDMTFFDQDGSSHSLGDLSGKTSIIVPFITLCPDTCPFTTGNLLQLSAKLSADHDTNVQIIALSLDPGRDTPNRLAAYACTLVGAAISPSTTTGSSCVSTFDAAFPNLKFWTVAPPGSDQAATFVTPAALAAFTNYLGMSVVYTRPGVNPTSNDWWLGSPINYDIDHSDGFYVVDPSSSVGFVSQDAPHFVGLLATALKNYLNKGGLFRLTHPYKGWNPTQAFQAMEYVAGTNL